MLYLHREAAINAFPEMFDNEAEAMEWLRARQALLPGAPAWR